MELAEKQSIAICGVWNQAIAAGTIKQPEELQKWAEAAARELKVATGQGQLADSSKEDLFYSLLGRISASTNHLELESVGQKIKKNMVVLSEDEQKALRRAYVKQGEGFGE